MGGQGRRGRPGKGIPALLVCGLTIVGSLALGAAPASAATNIVASYEMNEGRGSSVMIDSGPYGHNGVIGSDIEAGATYGGATGYRWPQASPTAPPAKPGRIAYVNSTSAHNPGDGDYAVEFRYRTTKSYGNVVQKGQNASQGGYFKFEQPNGFMTCLFKDISGRQVAVNSPVATKDGQWHVIRCELSDWGIRLYVDGSQVASRKVSMDTIANTKRLSIGGKSDCDQITVTCDYFTGDIDYVRIEKSGSAPPPPPTSVDCTVNWSGSTATLNWNPTGGTDVVRRNGSWLTTPSPGTSTYVDQNAPSGASYLIRTRSNGGTTDHPCAGSAPPPPPPPPTGVGRLHGQLGRARRRRSTGTRPAAPTSYVATAVGSPRHRPVPVRMSTRTRRRAPATSSGPGPTPAPATTRAPGRHRHHRRRHRRHLARAALSWSTVPR